MAKEIDYHRYWKDRAESAEAEIERVKKEADELMMKKIVKYENEKHLSNWIRKADYKFLVDENLELRRKITELEQEILEVKADNMKLARQIEDRIDQLRKTGIV